jgi:tetratricopeptide (TPR) repeat protein
VYPKEAQAHYLAGLINMNQKKYESAYRNIQDYDRLMPGNPNSLFFKGYALEKMQKKKSAAEQYYRYLQKINQGEQAQYAYGRLVEWGYVKK